MVVADGSSDEEYFDDGKTMTSSRKIPSPSTTAPFSSPMTRIRSIEVNLNPSTPDSPSSPDRKRQKLTRSEGLVAEEQALAITEVPNCYSNTITGSHDIQWKEAIKGELLSLQAKNTWDLVKCDKSTSTD